MSRPSYVATAGGFCMAGSSGPATPAVSASEAAAKAAPSSQPVATIKKPA